MGRDDSYKGIEKDAITYAARTITAGFIKRLAGDRTTSAWNFSMEGNCWLSFNRLAGLSPRSFAALLMAADFVQPRSGQVRFNRVGFEKFMKNDHYGLGGDSLGCSEYTFSAVWLNKINPSAEARKRKIHLIRIGHYKEQGETLNAAKQGQEWRQAISKC